VLSELGRLPEVGDEIVVEGRTMTVLELDGRRIARLRVSAPAEPPPGDDDEGARNEESTEAR
jgi:putative hemolysin